MDKKQSRLRRARQTRLKIRELRARRLVVHRSNTHMYATIVEAGGDRVLVSASTLERELREQLAAQPGRGGNLVSSTRVADARLEVRGHGDIDRSHTVGWRARFFLSFLPI